MSKPQMSAWEQVNLAAALADMKERHYRLLLAYGALLDVLADKGLVTREELEQRAAQLDAEAGPAISSLLHPTS